VELERAAVTSELAARCNAQLRYRADRLLAERRAARLLLEQSDVERHAAAAYADLPARSRELATRRMIAGHTIGARTVPVDTGREHGPVAERVRHHLTGRRGWLVASSDSGRLSLVLWRDTSAPGRTSWHPTSATRLGWGS
jgi:hypothetical protein